MSQKNGRGYKSFSLGIFSLGAQIPNNETECHHFM